MARTCSACNGAGSIIPDPCQSCRGETRTARETKLGVKVPPGVEDGTRIRYSGEGDSGRFGGPKGDLYVVLSIRAHDVFERQGNDLHCVVPISFPQAALGAEIEIESIDGSGSAQNPRRHAERQRDSRPRPRRSHPEQQRQGDLIVTVAVQVPKKLSKVQRELMRQLADSLAIENKPASPSFLDKMKDLFN